MPLTGINFNSLRASAHQKLSDIIKGETDEWCYTNNICYTYLNEYGGLTIYDYKANEKNVVIPSEINGIPVTCVAGLYTDKDQGETYDMPYWDTSNVESIVVPSSVKVLYGSFRDLVNLKSVTLSEGLEVISGGTFKNTQVAEVNIPDSVHTIYESAFEGSLVKEVEFGYNMNLYDFSKYSGGGVEQFTFNAPEIQLANIHKATVNRIICNGMLDSVDKTYDTDEKDVMRNQNFELICNAGTYYQVHFEYTNERGLYAHFNEEDGTVTYNTIPTETKTEYVNGDYKYYLNINNEAVISRYIGTSGEVIVPETLDGYVVTEIGETAFYAESKKEFFDNLIPQNQITSVVLPETIKKIGSMAFSFNKSLVSINIPDAVTVLQTRTFEGCFSLKDIDWSENLKTIGPMAFYLCNGLIDLQIPDGVIEIGSLAFGRCQNLQNISLPETLTNIGNYAFCENYSLKSVSIPDSVTELGIGAFMFCEAMIEAKLPDKIDVIPESLFECAPLNGIEFPETVTKIEAYAFAGAKLGNVKLPKELKSIDYHGLDSAGITELNLPSTVEYIGSYAFSGNEFKTLVIDWKNITTIENGVFYWSENLKRVEITGDIEEIRASAFELCEQLEEIIIGDNVKKIYDNAFRYNDALQTVTIHENINYLGAAVFGDCPNLKSVNYNAKNCRTNGTKSKSSFMNSGVTDLFIGNMVELIDSCLFANMRALVNVTLPDSLEYIGVSAFESCSSLVEINIPTNLKILGYHSFSKCKNLTTVYFNAMNCKVSDRFGKEAYVPEDWATASPFYLTNITNIIFGENVTAISSQSDTYGTFESCETLETVSIPNTVEEIGTAAFKNCTNLETAVIPDSVEEIADDAFFGCDNLTIYCSEQSYAYAYATANNISVSTLIISAIPNKTYTGNAIKPAVTVTVASTILTKDVDYSVSYSNNINVGQATVIVNGMGEYANFSSKANFTIITKNISKVSISEIKDQNYTGKAVEPSLTITDNGRYLTEGKDYRVSYYNNTSQGTASVAISGIGNYSGTVHTSFKITELDTSEMFINWLFSFITDFFAKIVSFFSVLR